MGRPRKTLVPEGEAPKQIAELARIDDAPAGSEKDLLAEIAALKAQLATSEGARDAAQESALALAHAQAGVVPSDIQEVPTGRTRLVEKCTGYKRAGFENGRALKEPIFEEVEVPTYFYRINMPPCGGSDLKINGAAYYHGATYEFDIDTLRSVKEIVYRAWDHDRQIHGSDENFYRQPSKTVLSARAGR